MNIKRTDRDGTIVLALDGRLTATTVPDLEAFIQECLGEKKDLELDFLNVDYVSSAGLRVMLSTHKSAQQSRLHFQMTNMCSDVYEIFQTTGFTEIMDIGRSMALES